MSYLEQLHSEHKARLDRMSDAAQKLRERKKQAGPPPSKPAKVTKADGFRSLRSLRIERIANLDQISQQAFLDSQWQIEKIKKLVCQTYDITKSEMLADLRFWRITHPRQIAFYLAFRRTRASSTAIGIAFKRDHATVLYGLKRIAALRRVNRQVDAEVAALEAKLDAAKLQTMGVRE